jgi:hypothetical protein
MSKPPPLTRADGDVRELSAEDLERFRDARSLPPSLQRKLGVRGPQKAPSKKHVRRRARRTVSGRHSRRREAEHHDEAR